MKSEIFQKLFNEAMPLLEAQLKAKGTVLAKTRGNGYRLAEKIVASFPGGVVPDSVTPADLMARGYAAVLEDVNYTVNNGLKRTEFLFDVLPPKLAKHLERLGLSVVPVSKLKNAAADPERTTPLTPAEVEAYVAGIPHFDWRSAAVSNFVNKMTAAGKTRESIFKVVGEFLQIRGRVDAVQYLKSYETAVDAFKREHV
jgi:hypothetical protein